ncbi:HAD-superfamily hydrolase, subfamily IA [Lachnospiraceae bacterium KM106-2]|nr:HAD-superfamily hydrolase, subfamily IA [Lachnospiraceae bacterium KM106-2]
MIKAVIFDMYETLITLFDSPIYFGTQIAEDMGIDVDVFRKDWDAMEQERSIGKVTLLQALEMIMHKNECYSETLLNQVITKRIATKKESFHHLHPEIIPMLIQLKNRGQKIGLISNCFSEEAMVIRESILYPYFDATFLSFEQGIQKPDKEIFRRCFTQLEVSPQECLYIGDGGSFELETAKELGMKALQAAWYLKEGTTQPAQLKSDFIHLYTPSDVLDYI